MRGLTKRQLGWLLVVLGVVSLVGWLGMSVISADSSWVAVLLRFALITLFLGFSLWPFGNRPA